MIDGIGDENDSRKTEHIMTKKTILKKLKRLKKNWFLKIAKSQSKTTNTNKLSKSLRRIYKT